MSKLRLPEDTALSHPGSHVRFWLFASIGLGLDLWSKGWVFDNVGPREYRNIAPGFLTLIRSVNEGALFGMGQGLRWVFVTASVGAFGFVLYLFAHSSRARWSLHVGLGLILAGAMGNLHDRALFGKVRDFIKITTKVLDYDIWPWVFNVADMCLVVGVGLLLINFWIDKRILENAAATAQQQPLDAEPD